MKDLEVLTVSRLESTNFISDIITAIMMAVAAGTMVVTSFDTGATFTAILENNWDYVVGVSIPALVTFVTKVVKSIKTNGFSWKAIFQSKNAITKLLVILSGIFGLINVTLADNMPDVLGDAIFSGSVASIIAAVVATIINPIWHILFDNDGEDTPEKIIEV